MWYSPTEAVLLPLLSGGAPKPRSMGYIGEDGLEFWEEQEASLEASGWGGWKN